MEIGPANFVLFFCVFGVTDVLSDAEECRQPRVPALSKEEHWFLQHTISHIRCWPYGSRLRPPSGRRKDKELTSAYYPPKGSSG